VTYSKTEDERILLLYSVFPAQWRTISKFIGRTAHQCMERFEKINTMAGMDLGSMSRNVACGEGFSGCFDVQVEALPPLTGTDVGENDFAEVLAEARCRICNTRGKKARRRSREKQISFGSYSGARLNSRGSFANGLSQSISVCGGIS
jgi:pre-mRNA-splicing factor CDC5/CEF1